MGIEWLKNSGAHVGPGHVVGGLTFREQDEVAARKKREGVKADRKKKREAKKQRELLRSKIDEAMELLKKAILLEMGELVEKHREKCRQCRKFGQQGH